MMPSVKSLRDRYGQKALGSYSTEYQKRLTQEVHRILGPPSDKRFVWGGTLRLTWDQHDMSEQEGRDGMEELYMRFQHWIQQNRLDSTINGWICDIPPFPRSVRPASSVLFWNNGTVAKMAHVIYGSRDFSQLPVLADALEEAGYMQPEVLTALRRRNPDALYWIMNRTY